MFSPLPKSDKKVPNTFLLSVDRAQDSKMSHFLEDWMKSEKKKSEIKTPLPKFDQMTQTLQLPQQCTVASKSLWKIHFNTYPLCRTHA